MKNIRNSMTMRKKITLLTTISISSIALIGTVIAAGNLDNALLFGKVKADSTYNLSLNTTNRITSNISSTTSITHHTALGNDINFAYSNCDANNSYHAVINNGGTIINTTPLTGISGIVPTFTGGQLKMRAGYSSSDLGAYVNLKSGSEYEFVPGFYPRFVELTASGSSVSLSSVGYFYECAEDVVEAYVKVGSERSDYTGTYLIVDETASVALLAQDGLQNTFNVSIKDGRILKTSDAVDNQLVFTKSGSKYTIVNKGGEYLDYESSANGNLFWGSEYSSTVTFESGKFEIANSSHYLLFESDHFTYHRTSIPSGARKVSLYRANFTGDAESEAIYDVGIVATDSKASSYRVGDTFSSFVGGKGLKVSVNKSDGYQYELDSSEFTYEIKNGNVTVSATSPFASAGTFTVNVTYKNYFTDSYQITVSETGPVSDDYQLVTDESDLEVGMSVIITSADDGSCKAMSKTQNNNNRASESITISDGIPELTSNVCEFELQEGKSSGQFAFYDSNANGYIYAASSGSNYMRTESTLDANGSFTIEINSGNDADIVAQGSNTRNTIRYNSGNNPPIFSCYASGGQSAVYLFAKGIPSAVQVPVESVSLDKNSITLEGSGEYTLTATVLPANATNKELIWSSSEESVATVSQSGVVSAVGVGTTTITATSKADSTKKATCTVTVNPVSVTSVTLSPSELSLFVNDSSTLTATVAPSNATNKNVSWSVTNAVPSGCVTVSNGIVEAKAAGTATVKVTTADGNKEATCSVTVSNRSVSSITFGSPTATVKVGKTANLSVTIAPSNATTKTLSWNSSNTSVATLSNTSDSGCTVTGVSEGTSVIRASATDGSGVYGECTVTVQENTAIDTWTLVTDDSSLQEGDLLVLASRNEGKTAGDISSSIMGALASTFSNNNANISELNEDTVIFTLGGSDGAWTLSNASNQKIGTTAAKSVGWDSGTTTWDISISSGDATISSTDSSCGRFLYNVNSPRFTTYTSSTSSTMLLPQLYKGTSTSPVYPTSIEISGTSTIAASEMTQLSVSFAPASTNQKTLVWTSSDETVATVGNDGTVTGVASGTAVITAKAKESASDSQYTITDTFTITVTPIASVTLNKSELNLTVDGYENLTATVLPSNAPNKNVTWSVINANPSGCVTVNNGVVSAVAAGTATVKVVSNADNTKYATCAVTVTASGGGGGSSSEYEDVSIVGGTDCYNCTVNNVAGQKIGKNGGEVTITVPSGATELVVYAAAWSDSNGISLDITTDNAGVSVSPSSITLTSNSGISNNTPFTLSNASADDFKFTITLTGVSESTVITLTKTTTGKRCVVWGAQYGCTQVEAEGVSLSNVEVSPGGSAKIATTFTPAGANYHKELSWTKVSGPSTISVSQDGIVSATSAASIGSNVATIRAELTNVTISGQHPSATCTVSVVESQKDAWTLLFYVCGSNLESGNGDAKSDLQEILQVRAQQPDEVNIVVETGGCTSWQMPNVSSSKLQRWEIDSSCSSTNMRKVQELSNANMGDQSTFQAFLDWGVKNYPAEKYGVFMWNHGGAMDGCCFDDNYEAKSKAPNGNGLLPKELSAAASAVRSNNGMSEKFEFIAYDACLMAVQDIALWNARDFNYQISSQETEWSGGYDYDAWLPTLYSDPRSVSTPTVLAKIGDTFMDYYASKNDQTQSVFDLSKMAAYKTAFDNFTDAVTSVVTSNSAWSTFSGYINQALKYGYDEDASAYNNGYVYDIFDVKGAINAVKSGYSSNNTISSACSSVLNALNDVVIYNRTGNKAVVKGSCGMNLFCPLSGYNQLNGATYTNTSNVDVYYPANYDSTCTLFTKWQSFVEHYGSWGA